jgi:SPP1 gp7 family putative phage head morphogenesis protein
VNPLIAALLAAGVISAEEARTLNGLLNDGATRIEAEQRVAAAFASGFENQRSRLIRALDMGNVDYRDPMLPAFWAAEHDLLARDVLPTLTGIAQDVALTATVRSGGLADWRTVNEAVIAWTDSHYRSGAGDALGSIPNLDATAREAVADAVNRWQRGELNAGPGRGGLPRLIAELQNVEEFGVDRAARIAVTETTRIFAESERTAAQANPNMEYLVWQTSSDEATCLICAPMEGQRIPKGQTTFPGGYYPPAHPNCRCGVTAVTEFAAEVLSGAAGRETTVKQPFVFGKLPTIDAAIHPELQQAFKEEFELIARDFPVLRDWVNDFKTQTNKGSSGEWNQFDSAVEIPRFMSRNSIAEFNRELSASSAAKGAHYLISDDFRGLVRHELGHAIDIGTVERLKYSEALQDEYWNAKRVLRDKLGSISGYGDTTLREWIAERFDYERVSGERDLHNLMNEWIPQTREPTVRKNKKK